MPVEVNGGSFMSKNKSNKFSSNDLDIKEPTEMEKAIDELKGKAEKEESVEETAKPLMNAMASSETTAVSKVDTPVLGVVTGCDLLRVRKGPSVNDEVIAKLSKGTVVKVLEPTDEWLKVQETKTIGYCMTKFIEIQ
jgi:hypothetical protein